MAHYPSALPPFGDLVAIFFLVLAFWCMVAPFLRSMRGELGPALSRTCYPGLPPFPDFLRLVSYSADDAKVGDVVQLKAGGPFMTVLSTESCECLGVWAVYLENGRLDRRYYPCNALRRRLRPHESFHFPKSTT